MYLSDQCGGAGLFLGRLTAGLLKSLQVRLTAQLFCVISLKNLLSQSTEIQLRLLKKSPAPGGSVTLFIACILVVRLGKRKLSQRRTFSCFEEDDR